MLERFYGDVLAELGKHARKGGTGIGHAPWSGGSRSVTLGLAS
jgi:hypothetical protein